MYEEVRNRLLKGYFSAKDKKAYTHALKRQLIAGFGGCCIICKSKDRLQFAHMACTKVDGTGRGSYRRYADVIANKKKYRLMCMRCHAIFDTLLYCGGMKRRGAFSMLKSLVAEDEGVRVSDIITFNLEKNMFVLRGEFVKKQ
jgi:hypothetical protein